MRTVLPAVLALAGTIGGAQPPAECADSSRTGLTRVIALSRDALDSISGRLDARQFGGLRDSAARVRYAGAVRRMRQLTMRLRWRSASTSDLTEVLVASAELAVPTVVDLFADAPPAAVNRFFNAAQSAARCRSEARFAEFERKFFIKNGAAAERLNLLEIWLVARVPWFSEPTMGPVFRDPRPVEPIVRAQVLSYQVHARERSAVPSSPIYQVGLVRYLFGTSRVARALHHVGAAVAFERDYARNVSIGGVVAHVNRYQLGVLCGDRRCEAPVVVATFNFQAIRGVF